MRCFDQWMQDFCLYLVLHANMPAIIGYPEQWEWDSSAVPALHCNLIAWESSLS